jgi:hypothetical protein
MGAQLNFVFFAVCTQLIPVLAMTIFPFTKPDLFENSSAFVKRKVGGVPLITIVGGITMAYLLWMIIASPCIRPWAGALPRPPRDAAGLHRQRIDRLLYLGSYRMSKEGIDIS